jgi:COP9 signalosome complex subunit 2
MLMGSDINPFDSQETKPYKNDPRIAAMTELVDAYQNDHMHQYEAVLTKNIDEVTRNMRTKAVVKLVAPYTRFKLEFIARRLNISTPEVQDIVGFLIMDGQLRGKINQDAGTVEIESRADTDRMRAVGEWTSAIQSLASVVLNESEGFKTDDSGSVLGGGMQGLPTGPEGFASSQRAAGGGRRKPNRAPGK